MTTEFKGFVEVLSSKSGKTRQGRPWTAYSLKISDTNGDEMEPWFQCGFADPGLNKGDYIKFTAEKNDKGAYTVNVDSIKKAKNPPARVQKRDTGNGGGGSSGGSGYNSEAQRADRAYHASRGSAIELVNILMQHQSLPVSVAQGKAGKAKRYAEILAFVDKITVRYFRDEFPEGFEEQFRLLAAVADAGEEELGSGATVGDLPDSLNDEPEFDDDGGDEAFASDDDTGSDDDDPEFE